MNMNILGIVTEYNPFHNGHKLHIEKSKKLTNSNYVVAVMSSNFVQRGEPALLDKWSRAKMALSAGADVVIELPVIYSTSGAEYFSRASVKLLNDTGIVNKLCFGSECGNILQLSRISDIIFSEPENYKNILKEELAKGIVFPAARASAINKIIGEDISILDSPNNILGVEYLKTLRLINSKIEPYTIKREFSDYNSTAIKGNFVSATAIRNAVINNELSNLINVMPNTAYNILIKTLEQNMSPITLNKFSHILNYRLRAMDINELQQISEITEGLENRILKASDSFYDIKDIADFTKSKRYTYTKIQRALLHVILDIKTYDLDYFNTVGCSQYIKVIGFKKESEHLLSLMCKNSSIPVITNLKKSEKLLDKDALKMLAIEKKATDLYYMVSPNKHFRQRNKEYTMPIVVI